MQRIVITANGEVQGVGYRTVVRRIAIKLNLVGRVKNVKPYDVQMVAEGEKENIKKFIEAIKIKEFPINVESINVKYEEPAGEFDSFEIERGSLEEELGERLDVARDVMNVMIEKQDQMIEKQDKTIEIIGGKIDQGFSKMDQNFTTLRQDYGRISDTMLEINKSLKMIAENLGKKDKSTFL